MPTVQGCLCLSPCWKKNVRIFFPEHGGRVRSLGAREAEDNGAGGVDSDGRIGLGTAARSQRGGRLTLPSAAKDLASCPT